MALKTYVQTNLPHLPPSRQSLRLVINGMASHFKGRFFTSHSLPVQDSPTDIRTTPDDSVGVAPREAYEGRYYDTDLSLGLTETADDILRVH